MPPIPPSRDGASHKGQQDMAARNRYLTLPDETWGDQIHRAYRHARSRFGRRDPVTGRASFSYEAVAERMRQAGLDLTDQVLMRLEDHEELPSRMKQRQIAYFALIAYGYDPADFGLTPDNVALAAFDLPKIKKALAPRFSCSPRRETERVAA